MPSSSRLALLVVLVLAAAPAVAQRTGLTIERGLLRDGLPAARTVRLADLDRDGRRDVLRLRLRGLEVLLQGPTGLLSSATVPGLSVGNPGPVLVDLAIGRFDPSRDPFDDVAVLYSDGSVDLLVNDGMGGLQVWMPRPVNLNVRGPGSQILAADLNGDPFPDLLVLMDFVPPTILAGTPTGFVNVTATSVPLGISQPGQRAAAADFDGDTDVDLAIVSVRSTVPLLLLENVGRGVFQIRNAAPSIGVSGARVLALDVLGTPLPDLVIGVPGNFVSSPLLLQNTAFNFAQVPIGAFRASGALDLVAGDLTGDRRPDLVALESDGTVLLGVHDGTSMFGSARPLLQAAPRAGVAVGDLEGDGDLDLFAAGMGLEDQVLLGDGSGAFQQTEETGFPIGALPQDSPAALVDADGNGDPDLIAFTPGGMPVAFLNDGTPRFTGVAGTSLVPSLPTTTVWREARALAVAAPARRDLLVVGNQNPVNPTAVRILVWRGGGYVDETNTRWTLGNRTIATAAPLSRGGTDDVVVATGTGELLLMANRLGVYSLASGAFPPGLGLQPSRILIGDLDGNRTQDVVVLQPSANPRVFLSTPGAGFVEVANAVSFGVGGAGTLADLDGDNVLDLLLSGGAGFAGPLALLGTGRGTFVDVTARLLAAVPSMLLADAAVIDVEGRRRIVFARDGQPDLMATWQGSAYGAVAELPFRGSVRSRRLLADDLDRDGDTDLVVLRFDTTPLLLRGDAVHLGQVGAAQAGRSLTIRLVSPVPGAFAALAVGPSRPPVATPFGLLRLQPPAWTVWTGLLAPLQRQVLLPVPLQAGLLPVRLPMQAAFLDARAGAVHLSNLEIATVTDH